MRTLNLSRLLPLATLAAALLAAPTVLRAQMPAPVPGVTTVIVVRHAEKATDDPQDPALTPAGHARAAVLAQMLNGTTVSAIYTTQYKRTHETAEPLSAASGVAVTERPIGAANSATYAQDLAREIMATQRGKTVVVVGHSNTVPAIVQALSGQTVPDIADTEYDHLFVVQIPATGTPTVLSNHYGLRTGSTVL
ncbi:MAG TPA: phosphoglycerate mutase family protein [Longimicrobiaceae bacterium]|jgi:broad specificity phosphatase PhoE|nr:phosphoglycerate mutase family protein [Longimicrobiaceae bacterium]